MWRKRMKRGEARAASLIGIAVALVIMGTDGRGWAKPVEEVRKSISENGHPARSVALAADGTEKGPADRPSRSPEAEPVVPREEGVFAIRDFAVYGNTLLPEDRLQEVLSKHKGERKTIKDIDSLRQELEKAYHTKGYPAVIVAVPEQTVESGTIRLEIVEGRLGEISVVGNKWYSRYNILGKLPSVKIGATLYEPTLVKELDALNANPDLKVTPLLKPGTEQGLVKMELKVRERMPFHAKLQGDNQGALTTPVNRMTLEAQYTNLWDMDHIVNLSTIQTPEDWGAVQTYSGSYVVPIRWPDHMLSIYASKTFSTSSISAASLGVTGAAITIAGEATVAGARYSFPIASSARSVHQLSLGVDFRRLEKTEATFPGALGTAVVLSPFHYAPLSVGYNASLADTWGVTRLSATGKGYAAILPGGQKADFAGDPNDPFNKPGVRRGSTGNFAVVQGSIDRLHELPLGAELALRVDGQWGSEPLAVTEQYFAGGMDTVRGYVQFETLGDHAVRGRAELTSPTLWPVPFDYMWQRRRSSEWDVKWKVAAFYDTANLWVRDASQGQRDQFRLESVGWGLRIRMPKDFGTVRIDQGYALQDGTVTKRGDSFVHFIVNVVY